MFGREDLIWEWSDDLDAGFKVYDVEKVNEIMDRMEARIKELEAENKKLEDDWQKSYAEECVTRHENHNLVDRIEELETKLAKEKAYSHSLREELSNYNELYKH